jgi:hypothetical protein
MRRKWSAVVLLVFAALLTCAQTAIKSPRNGVIVGTVLNEEGQLVDHAMVCTSVTAGNKTSINCLVPTDKEGRFTIEHLEIGTYRVFAINEAEGYSIENQGPGQVVRITADEPWADVTVRLRPKGGVLIGSIRDKMNSKPIKTASVRYLAIDNGGGGFGRTDGEFQMTVPADCDLLIVASAPGYKGWVYTDTSSPSRPVLRLASGERKVLEIELEPLPKDPTPH